MKNTQDLVRLTGNKTKKQEFAQSNCGNRGT